jgi:nitroreductase
MRPAAPSAAQIARLVAAANAAPSADNCQPWRFRWGGEELEIRLDPARARHVIDAHGHASLFTLGGALEALSIAATAERLEARARLTLDRPAGAAWAAVRFAERPAPPHELAGALHLRCTDRRFFRGGSLSDGVFAAIRRDAAASPDLAVHLCERFPPELVAYVAAADAYVWRTEEVYRDIIRWIRFTRREVEETRDGIPWRSFGLDLPEIGALRICRARLAERLLPRLHLDVPARIWVARHLASSAAIACFTVRRPSPEALVAAGRLVFASWVRLNRAGYGVQPLGIQSLQIYNAETRGLPAGTLPELSALFRGGREVVARAFGLPDGELPVWMLRTGLSSPLPPDARTLRLPLDRVLTAAGGRAGGAR